MNRTGKNPASSTALPSFSPGSIWLGHRPTAAGFSLVEILVTALLIGVGLLGMAALQGRTVGYTTEATQRSTAAMLAADLLELIRATPDAWTHFLRSAPAAHSGTAACTATPSVPSEQLGCWRTEVATLLPSSAELPASSTYVCLSPAAGACASHGAAIEIQVVWKGSYCLNAHGQCHVRLRSEI